MMLLIIFNAFDTFFSVKYIKFGPLSESNPIMNVLLEDGPSLFIFYKIIIVTTFAILLYFQKNNKLANIILYLLTFVYGILMLWWTYVILLVQ